jgi:Microtubule binding
VCFAPVKMHTSLQAPTAVTMCTSALLACYTAHATAHIHTLHYTATTHRLQAEAAAAALRVAELEALYRDETALRKKYWNMMEDMKGKIRVFARCRPFAAYEKERGCSQCVAFLDETTLEVTGTRGPKQFVFDNAFPPSTGQVR